MLHVVPHSLDSTSYEWKFRHGKPTLSLFVLVSQIASFMETWLGKFAKFVTGSTLIEAALAK